MAKSLRSKWRRKCRAVKRERYAAKELERLKKTLGVDEKTSADVEMTNLDEIATGKILSHCRGVKLYYIYAHIYVVI